MYYLARNKIYHYTPETTILKSKEDLDSHLKLALGETLNYVKRCAIHNSFSGWKEFNSLSEAIEYVRGTIPTKEETSLSNWERVEKENKICVRYLDELKEEDVRDF